MGFPLDALRRSYDRFAPRYDEIFAPQQLPKIEALIAALPSPLPQPMADLGAGIGLAARVVPTPLVSIDASIGMLRHAEGRRVVADLHRLPFADGHFGAAICVTALLEFDDAMPAVTEIARVLRPGGWLAISVLKSDDVASLQRALPTAGFALVRRLDLEQDIGFIGRLPPVFDG